MAIPLTILLLMTGLAVAGEKLHVHFLSASKEYESEKSLKAYEAYLEENFPLEVTASWGEDGGSGLENADQIAEAEVLLVFARRMTLSRADLAKVSAHWEAQKGIVGVRTASHAFSKEANRTFDRKIMGGNYDGHFGDEKVTVSKAGGPGHPILAGVGDFMSAKLYRTKSLAPTATLLQNGTIRIKGDEATEAVTWVNRYGEKGRSFYTSLGVPGDFKNPDFRKMLTQAIFWTAGREIPARESGDEAPRQFPTQR